LKATFVIGDVRGGMETY